MRDHPDIEACERTGYPDGQEPKYPHCPICGAECESVYRDKNMEIVGCDECLIWCCGWETDECFPNE